ncbi:hypothetical protein BKA03_000208 [Demequina lutea]|uniref:Uncharacterized protein n=1 Tax=Demequina lutea TaxID=431489 RepID=A0A7Y9Z780_9MICO|nr:hypothetical protein [Demequina lutea]
MHIIDRIILVVMGALFGAGLTLFITYDWMSRTEIVLCTLVATIGLPYSAIRSSQRRRSARATSQFAGASLAARHSLEDERCRSASRPAFRASRP